MSSVLKLAQVTKSFGDAANKIEVLHQINLEILRGEFVALTGPSGSGKTTLLQIAGLLDAASSGQVLVNGSDTSNFDDEQRTEIRKKNIGFIYQFHHLLPEFSALENVMLPLLIHGLHKSEARKQAEEMLYQVGLSDRLHHKPSELSGGQQQRVAIARAIITKPSLILADEPTGNLDSAMSEKIFELIQNMIQSHQIACLMVTHNNEIAKKADRIISIKDGAIQ